MQLLQFKENRGLVYMDADGAVWWDSQTGKPPELLADKDSLCGIFPFETGVCDIFRDCCSAHDKFYTNRAQYEGWGFDRFWMDDQFLQYMKRRSGTDAKLLERAQEYYMAVRLLGWMFYYRHPGKASNENMQTMLAATLPQRPIRRYGWKPDVTDSRDLLYSVVRTVPETLPSRVDMKMETSEIFNQGQLGSCTAHALAEAHMFAQSRQGALFQFIPSRLFIYFNERMVEGTIDSDTGAAIRDGIKTLNKYGVCPEQLWDYSRDFRVRPTTDCYQEAKGHAIQQYLRIRTLQDLKHSLADGWPVVFGFSVYNSFESDEVAETGVVPFPAAHESMLGGHAVLAVGYDDSVQRIVCQNSWGVDWGDNGFFYLPYRFMTDGLAEDFWSITQVR